MNVSGRLRARHVDGPQLVRLNLYSLMVVYGVTEGARLLSGILLVEKLKRIEKGHYRGTESWGIRNTGVPHIIADCPCGWFFHQGLLQYFRPSPSGIPGPAEALAHRLEALDRFGRRLSTGTQGCDEASSGSGSGGGTGARGCEEEQSSHGSSGAQGEMRTFRICTWVLFKMKKRCYLKRKRGQSCRIVPTKEIPWGLKTHSLAQNAQSLANLLK